MHPLNGLLLVDKPPGLTSHDVVGQVRRVLGLKAVGHAGTLDPLASGLMILLIGEATKVSDYLLNGNKGYEVGVQLGVKTDSMDITGTVLETKPVASSLLEIREAACALSGPTLLDIPLHSAVKVDGKKLYEYAHKGQVAPSEIPKRLMDFYDVRPTEVFADSLVAEIHCSKGSFIRAWAEELGQRLGGGASVKSLRRIRSEPFDLGRAITLERFKELWLAQTERRGSVFGHAWIPLKDSLPHFARIDVSGHDEYLLKNGQISKTVQAKLLSMIQFGVVPPQVRVIARETDDLLALLIHKPEQFYKIRRVFSTI